MTTQGTDFDTTPAIAAGLPVGTKITLANSIFIEIYDTESDYLVIDDSYQHSGSFSATAFGSGDAYIEAYVAEDSGPIVEVAEDFYYWFYYEHPNRSLFGVDGVNEPWLNLYSLYTGTLGSDRDNWDWEIVTIYVRRRTNNLEWRVLFADNSVEVFNGPLSTWTKIHVTTTLEGDVSVTLSTSSSILNTANSVPGYLASLDQFFAAHALWFRKESVYGQYWVDDINYTLQLGRLKLVTPEGWKYVSPRAGENDGLGRLKVRTPAGWKYANPIYGENT